ncbi:type VII secretion protein EccB [Gordonia sp. X0973]|uniref:type VII secretion protein EccB n=1 Tax=Gordonia sp. X0973 TaxID=2742602 RepID=UPI0013EE1A2B|nr:type VII secretion protein EccB [Gordonia sp. X0973]QKT06990.1 type VII secretion protein EccB [Gordonia sp. X0973]
MAKRTTTPQVNGYRFLVRRLEHALVRRDVRMIQDPMGAQVKSLMIGLIITVLIVGIGLVMSFFKPQGSVGDAKILVSKNSGSLYALVDNRLHPVLNLTSARLATGSAESPTSVKESLLDKFPRGSLIGIPGAPWSLEANGSGSPSQWTVCDKTSNPNNADSSTAVAVIVGDVASTPHLTGKSGLLVTVGGKEYLITDNSRAEINTDDTAVADALKLQMVTPRPISRAVLNAIPAARPIVAPTIADAGKPSRFALGARTPIGSIIESDAVGGKELYALLPDGVESISPLVASMIQVRYRSSVVQVNPADLASVPRVKALGVQSYPTEAPHMVDNPSALCFQWSPSGIALTMGPEVPVPTGTTMVPVIGRTGAGAQADAVALPPGKGWAVRTTGNTPDSTRMDSYFFVSDTGVRFAVPDADVSVLGLPEPQRAPWAIVSLLPSGPMLSREAALVERVDIDTASQTGK